MGILLIPLIFLEGLLLIIAIIFIIIIIFNKKVRKLFTILLIILFTIGLYIFEGINYLFGQMGNDGNYLFGQINNGGYYLFGQMGNGGYYLSFNFNILYIILFIILFFNIYDYYILSKKEVNDTKNTKNSDNIKKVKNNLISIENKSKINGTIIFLIIFSLILLILKLFINL